MKTSLIVLASSLLAAWAPVQAESLYEKRLAVIKGTSPGVTLIGPGGKIADTGPKASNPAASAASAGAASGSAPAARTAAQAAPEQPSEPGTWLQRLVGPPSGKSLSEAKRLDSPDQGIRLPTASKAASQPADGAETKR